MSIPKTKMLCLHGFEQNPVVFNTKLASFRSKLKNRFDFIIPQAPNVLPKQNEDNPEEEFVYAWYYYSEETPLDIEWDKLIDSVSDIDQLFGLKHSIETIKNCLLEHPDIEYILGFSQGAAMLSLLCKLGMISNNKKLIFVSGFYPLKYDTLCENFSHQNTIHVWGELDTIILPKFSEALSQFFPDPQIIKHKGKHVVPRIKL